MRDNRDDIPTLSGESQTILDHITAERRKVENYVNRKIGEVHRRLDTIEERLENVENDVNTIAKNTEHERDERGQLQKTA